MVAAPATARGSALIAAAGDIACDPYSRYFNDGQGTSGHCRQKATSNMLIDRGYAAVLPLGDNQYVNGSLNKFNASYDLSWGRVIGISHPVLGNHEYRTADAAGYFDYFNGQGNVGGPAGNRGEGYYSFDVGAWHLIALNTSCAGTDAACAPTPDQEQWLRADLASHANRCVLAYWHHPTFSPHATSSRDKATPATVPLFSALYEAGADVLLVGHTHSYHRFRRLAPDGTPDSASGIRQFVVGTGGVERPRFTIRNPDDRAHAFHFGVLRMRLDDDRYHWVFRNPAGTTYDSGDTNCH